MKNNFLPRLKLAPTSTDVKKLWHLFFPKSEAFSFLRHNHVEVNVSNYRINFWCAIASFHIWKTQNRILDRSTIENWKIYQTGKINSNRNVSAWGAYKPILEGIFTQTQKAKSICEICEQLWSELFSSNMDKSWSNIGYNPCSYSSYLHVYPGTLFFKVLYRFALSIQPSKAEWILHPKKIFYWKIKLDKTRIVVRRTPWGWYNNLQKGPFLRRWESVFSPRLHPRRTLLRVRRNIIGANRDVGLSIRTRINVFMMLKQDLGNSFQNKNCAS